MRTAPGSPRRRFFVCAYNDRMIRAVVFLLAVSLSSAYSAYSAYSAAAAQSSLPRERVNHELPQHETAHLTIATSAAPERVVPGQKIALTLDVTPKPKIHVYAPGQEGYIPIS